jgi:predicted metal-dependent hydrolase
MWFAKLKSPKSEVIESTLDLAYPVSVRRSSRRRSIELRVTSSGQVRLLCPLAMTDSQISVFIDSKASWIHSKLQQRELRQVESVSFLENGSLWRFRGQTLRLKLCTGREHVATDDVYLTVSAGTDDFRHVLKAWYIDKAEEHLLNRTNYFSQQMNLSPSKVQLKAYRSMWGRCNSRQEIAYDWRIIQAPDAVIDYLVVHELAHLRHFDHSSAFWHLVGSHVPTFPEAKHWLRANAYWMKQTLSAD